MYTGARESREKEEAQGAQRKRFSAENSMDMETMQQRHCAEHQMGVGYSACLFGAFPYHSGKVLA